MENRGCPSGKKIARALASLNPTNYTTEESFITVGYDKNMI